MELWLSEEQRGFFGVCYIPPCEQTLVENPRSGSRLFWMAAGLFPPMSCWACSNISCRYDHLRSGHGVRRLVREIDWLNGV